MEKQKTNRYRTALLAYAVIFLLLLLASNLDTLKHILTTVLGVLRPLIIGLVIAYLINPFFRFFERRMLIRIRQPKLRRTFSLILTYLVLFLIIGVLLMLIIPQLIDSIGSFIADADQHWNNAIQQINDLIGRINTMLDEAGSMQEIEMLEPSSLLKSLRDLLSRIRPTYQDFFNYLLSGKLTLLWQTAASIARIVTEILVGLFLSLYFLCTKEKRYAQVMRVRAALFGNRTNHFITRVCETADRSFGGFIRGKVLDSCIVGCLVYAALLLLDIPYPILIAVIVAITDIVPVIGPFIGVIPSALIILLTDPIKVIPFLLCILLVQQIDGNIIAPKILGENTGVSSLCVIIAITTMGALWDFAGMIIGVPLFATVLELTSDFLNRRLEKRGFSLAEEEEETPKRHPRRRRRKAEVPALEGGTGSLSEEECTHLEALAAADEYRLLTDFSEESLERYVEARRAAARDAEQSDITDITDVPAVPADAEASESPTESAECAAVSD